MQADTSRSGLIDGPIIPRGTHDALPHCPQERRCFGTHRFFSPAAARARSQDALELGSQHPRTGHAPRALTMAHAARDLHAHPGIVPWMASCALSMMEPEGFRGAPCTISSRLRPGALPSFGADSIILHNLRRPRPNDFFFRVSAVPNWGHLLRLLLAEHQLLASSWSGCHGHSCQSRHHAHGVGCN